MLWRTWYEAHCWLDYRWKRIQCWFLGHEERSGGPYLCDPDYCDRCGLEWPQEDTGTLYLRLNRWYGWMVEKDWPWFAALDDWLARHPRVLRRFPSWWSY
jgi:hypothetical protein